MKRIAIYGGSFDPPHLGHVLSITAVLNSNLVDQIWVVPTGVRDDKETHGIPDDRRNLIDIMLTTEFDAKDPVYLNTTQLEQKDTLSTTFSLLQDMIRWHPDNEFLFVIGADLVQDIPNWADSEKLMAAQKFIMVPRLGINEPTPLPKYILRILGNPIAATNISSSLVRKMISSGQSLVGIVPLSIIKYIANNNLYNSCRQTQEKPGPATIYNGKFIRFMTNNHWEYVERTNCTGIVIIIAVTQENELIFTEQYRPPVRKRVIEFPAGLVNDLNLAEDKSNQTAAKRELLEETGYVAKTMVEVASGPTSAGLTNELVTVLLAEKCEKIAEGGGDESESIIAHAVPLDCVDQWLEDIQENGRLVDPRIYAGLYFVTNRR